MPVHESPESASPSVTRAVAAALTNESFRSLPLPDWQRGLLQIMDAVSPGLLAGLVRWENKRRALPRSAASLVDINNLAADRIGDYAGWQGETNAILLGSSLGGAAAYMSAALAAPFLPEPFILGFEGGSADDGVEPHLEKAIRLAEIVGANNPRASLISHYDPVHDGWLTGFINHLRLKLGHLPAAYRSFIKDHLKSGGSLVHLDCQARWLSFPLSERHRYQIGGWGGIPPTEFLEGSQRLDEFLANKGSSHRGGWRLPGIEPEWSPESEWGSEAPFARAVQTFAQENDYRYLPVRMPVPHHYSWLTYQLYQRLWRKRGVEPRAALVGMFNQYDPVTALNCGLLPLWLVFNTEDSLAFLREVAGELNSKQIYFAALVTYSQTPDMVPWVDWAAALRGTNWVSIGARPSRYPEDTVSLWRWQDRLRKFTEAVQVPQRYLTVEDLEEELAAVKSWTDRIPRSPIGDRPVESL